MLNGRYDYDVSIEAITAPIFSLSRYAGQRQKHGIYEGEHGAFPCLDAVRECLDWLDSI